MPCGFTAHPEGEHDVDLVVAEPDVESAADCLAAAGFEIERPPEDWLFKAHLDGAMVDVLHRLAGEPVDHDRSSRPWSARCWGCGFRCCRRPM